MKEKIGRLARGIIDSETAVIHITPQEIDEKLMPGEIYKSEIHMKSEGRLRFRGLIYSSNPRVKLQSESFSGVFAYIGYNVDTSHLEDGEIISGRFSVVTGSGEFVIPYLFTLKQKEPEKHIIGDNKAEDAAAPVRPFPLPADTKAEVPSFEIKNNAEPRFDTPVRRVIAYKKAKVDFLTDPAKKLVALTSMQQRLAELGAAVPVYPETEKLLEEFGRIKDGTYTECRVADPMNRLRELRFRYEKGERSAELYIEAAKAYSEQPDLFRGFDVFTLQAINAGTRYRLLSGELIELLSETVSLEKHPTGLLILMLKRLYVYAPRKKILEYLCAYYIKKEKTDAAAFKWYLEGVKRDADTPGLYEFFLYSLPDGYSEVLPEAVYVYFSYNAPADDISKKKLYHSIAAHFSRETHIYRLFEPSIKEYVREKIAGGEADLYLALIYRSFLDEKSVDGNISKNLADILVTRVLTGLPPRAVRVIVTYDELVGEQQATVSGGTAVFPIYTDRYNLYIEFSDGGRMEYDGPAPSRLVTGKNYLLQLCRNYTPDMPMFLIADAGRIIQKNTLSEDDIVSLSYLSMADGVSKRFKTEINTAIINSYDWENDLNNRSILKECGKDRGLSGDTKARFIDLLIKLGEYEEAETQIKRLGTERVSSPALLSVCRNSIIEDSFEPDEYLICLAWGLFSKGISDDVTLNYLCRNYNGLVSEMKDLLFESKKRGYPVYDLPERLLTQMLFAGSYEGMDDVFRIYASEGTVQKNILFAYYVVKCNLYLSDEDELDAEIFDAVKRLLGTELITGTAPVIMQLAVSRYFSESDSLSADDEQICKKIVTYLTQRGIVLPYIKKLSGLIALPQEIKDKTLVAYNGSENESVTLVLFPEDDDEDPVLLKMTNVYAGLFVGSVLLFEGEHVSYEIHAERDDEVRTVASGELLADITDPGENRKFSRLNALIAGSAEPSDENWQKAMYDFALSDALSKELFD